jgi:ubiquitin carboxyl-terminal hydrolase 16/45
MIGGHYIAYCLVDPEKMFGTTPAEEDASPEMRNARPNEHSKKDRRVWCFCSE